VQSEGPNLKFSIVFKRAGKNKTKMKEKRFKNYFLPKIGFRQN